MRSLTVKWERLGEGKEERKGKEPLSCSDGKDQAEKMQEAGALLTSSSAHPWWPPQNLLRALRNTVSKGLPETTMARVECPSWSPSVSLVCGTRGTVLFGVSWTVWVKSPQMFYSQNTYLHYPASWFRFLKTPYFISLPKVSLLIKCFLLKVSNVNTWILPIFCFCF